MSDYFNDAEGSQAGCHDETVVSRQPRSEKFRMVQRRPVKKAAARPMQFNGIHRRRLRKVRI